MAGEQLSARFSLGSQLWSRGTGKCFETATSHMQTVVVNSTNMKYLILILILFTFFSFTRNSAVQQRKVTGQIVDSITMEGQPFLGIKLFLNDTLRGFSISDLDGNFTAQCQKEIELTDRINLEFHSPSGMFDQREIHPFTNRKIIVYYKMEDSISTKELYKWYGHFSYFMPNYLDCHPEGSLDEFEIRGKN